MYFPRLTACASDDVDLVTYISVIASLLEEFASRFADVKGLAADFKLSLFRDLILPTNNFPKDIAHVQHILAMFGSTSCCEQLFSKIKYTKSHLRHPLNDILLHRAEN